jgi:magnesium transporter
MFLQRTGHILTLQLALAHNERMLSHSHPAYMSNLRSELEMTKSGIDVKVLYLTTTTITALCIQTVTGVSGC